MTADLAFGVTAAERPDHARLGAELEQLGYREVWVNDTRTGDGLATLAAIASGTRSLGLGVGVIALSEQPPARILDRLGAVNLPPDRLTLGVGSGSSASLELVREGVAELRRLAPALTIAVAAVGPRMAHMAGEVADVVVANWALPERLAWIRERVAGGADAAGRRPPRLVAYVRTAVGLGATDRLRREKVRYRGYGAHYARAFDAQPDELIGVAIESGEPAAVGSALAPYRSVADTLVIRALPASDAVEAWIEVARAVAHARLSGGGRR